MSSRSRISWAIRWPVAPVPRTSIESRSGSQAATLVRPGEPLVENVQAGDLADLARVSSPSVSSVPASSSCPAGGGEPPSGVEGGGQQRVGAGRLDQRHRPVDRCPRRPGRPCRGGGWPTGSGCRRSCGCWRGPGRRRCEARPSAAPGGSRGGSPRPRRRPAGRRGRGRPRRAPRSGRRRRSRWARPASPPPPPGSDSSAASRASGVTQCAMPSSWSISGATNVGRRPESTRPSMIEEWTLRWTTTRPRWGGPVASLPVAWARAMQIAWFPPDAPLTRNQLRWAPQASAARRCARWKGVGSGPTSIPSMLGGTSWRIAASPRASISAGSAPVPLWPGMWKRPGSRAT